MGSAQVTEHAQHLTNVGYVGITCIVTLFEKFVRYWQWNQLQNSISHKEGVDPGLKY